MNEDLQDIFPKENIKIIRQYSALTSDGTSLSRRSLRKMMPVLQKDSESPILGARLES